MAEEEGNSFQSGAWHGRIEEAVNHLTKEVERINQQVAEGERKRDRARAETRAKWATYDAKLEHINRELNLYAFGIRMVKLAALIVVALVTLKFGDVPKLWHHFTQGGG